MSESENLSLDKLNFAHFEPHAGTTFRWNTEDGGTIELELAEAALVPTKMEIAEGMRAPFSLIFKVPVPEAPEQGMYPLEHDTLGKLELFLVPIGQIEGGFEMEAMFT